MIHPYSHYLERAAHRWPDKDAIVDGEMSLTYSELDRRVGKLAAGMRALGLAPGDRVALVQENNHRYVESVSAIARAGGVLVPMLGVLTEQEHAHIVSDCGAKLVIGLSARGVRRAALLGGTVVGPGAANDYEALISAHDPFDPRLDAAPDALAQILYTSGTTGKPKGVMHSHGSTSAGIAAWVYGVGVRHDDRLLGHFALSHFGGRVMDAGICTGATLVILSRPDPVQTLDALSEQRISVLLMVPTLMQTLLDHPSLPRQDLSSLRLVLYAAAPASPTLVRRAFDAFGPILATGFGQTEAYGLNTFLSASEHERALLNGSERLASIGREADASVQVRLLGTDNEDVKIGAVGEICVSAPWIMKGYWNSPDLTAEALDGGWLHTRDLGRQDEQGYFYIADRKEDMIISGGYNVYPREVEDTIAAVPGVSESCVVGVPDPKWGEAVRAIVVAEEVTDSQVIEHCKAHLAPFKVPKAVYFVTSLPKNSVGKILRREVRAPFWQGRERHVHGAE